MPQVGEAKRESQRKQMQRRAAEARDITIPAVANLDRRAECESDPELWLRTYLRAKFSHEFTDPQRDMLAEVLYRMRHGGSQSIAAERGGGKTTIVEGAMIFAVCVGEISFPLVIGATGPDASRLLANIKREFEGNATLAEDYPEICEPIRALGGAAQRAALQTVKGKRTYLKWGTEHVVMPTVEGSKASGAIIAARGIDGSVRGLKFGNRRPDFVLIDDADTRESAHSETQTASREEIVERDLAGLAGPGKRIAMVMLCTIINKRCLAWTYTERSTKPAWNGRRHKLLIERPENEDLWDDYIAKRQTGMQREENPDIDGREAHAFYLANRDRMDEGSKVSNPYRFDAGRLPDGSQVEVSTLQFCYNFIADHGPEPFLSEFQNEPPDEETPDEIGITGNLVQERINGIEWRVVPDDAPIVTAGIDCGKRALHFVQIAWKPGATGCVVDYGVEEVNNADEIGPEKAIVLALHSWRDRMLSDPLIRANGEPVTPSIVLIDSGAWDTAISDFLMAVGGRPFASSKGFGSAYRQSPFRSPPKVGRDKWVGDHWYIKRLPSGVYLHCLDTDYWKRWVHDRFMTPVQNDGSLSLHGDDRRRHFAYAKHIVSEVWREPMLINGKLRKAGWYVQSKNNHYFDATYQACAGAGMSGVSLLNRHAPASPTPNHERPKPAPPPEAPRSRAADAWTPAAWNV